MAASPTRSPAQRPDQRAPRSRGNIAGGIGKWLAAVLVAVYTLDYLRESSTNLALGLSGLLLLALFIASLAYLVFVPSRVRLHIPGIDEDALESMGEKAADDAERTIQTPRLSVGNVHVTIANDSPVPVLRAEASLVLEQEPESEHDGDQAPELVRTAPFSIAARSRQPVALSSAFDHVGIYRLHSTSVRIYDIIGLLSRSCKPIGQWRVRVVPNIYRLTRGIPQNRMTLNADLGIPNAPSDAIDYDRVRDYRPGDPLKTIHWKIVAHSQGELYTKLFETSTMSSATLLIDPRGLGETPPDAARHMYDTMLEGAFSLIEHARENGIAGRLLFTSKHGEPVGAKWEGPAMLGWYVEMAQRPSPTQSASDRSATMLTSLRDGRSGYVIFATSCLSERSVKELIACHHAGIPLIVVHALPTHSKHDNAQQLAYDALLQDESIDVVALTDGTQIVREVTG